MPDGRRDEQEKQMRQLVEKWREFATGTAGWTEYSEGVQDGVLGCARELEEMLDE